MNYGKRTRPLPRCANIWTRPASSLISPFDGPFSIERADRLDWEYDAQRMVVRSLQPSHMESIMAPLSAVEDLKDASVHPCVSLF